MVDARTFFAPHFLTVKDVGDKRLPKRIDRIEQGKFGKLNAIFDDNSALSLNATNCRTLVETLGAETDNWPGHDVEVFVGGVEYQGKEPPGVLLAVASLPMTPPKPPAPAPKRNNDMDDAIPF